MSRLIRPDDTSKWVHGCGTSADGNQTVVGTVDNINQWNAGFTGTSGATTGATTVNKLGACLIMNTTQMEFNYITAKTSSSVTLFYPLQNTYSAGTQIIVTRQLIRGDFTNISTAGWNTTSGGVIFLLGQIINVTGGSIIGGVTLGGNGDAYPSRYVSGGYQGGLDGNHKSWWGLSQYGEVGFGPTGGNIGGIYNQRCGGGGGGANGGKGGFGSYNSTDIEPNRGDGAAEKAPSINSKQPQMGSGGGGGNGSNSQHGERGGNGGGMLVVVAQQVSINGFNVTGGKGGNCYNRQWESGGGGGAGGSIWVKGARVQLSGSLLLNGGQGGGGRWQNMGGGGGGGFLKIECPSLINSATTSLTGGIKGDSDSSPEVHSAGAGGDGVYTYENISPLNNPSSLIYID